MKNVILFIAVLLANVLFTEVYAQDPDYFAQKFPELTSSLKPDGSVDVTSKNVMLFKMNYQKLKESYDEIEKYELGGASEENLKIFELKELKNIQKDSKLEELKLTVKNTQGKIKLLLKDKSQYGVDSLECLEKLSIFSSLVKNNDWESAYKPWKYLYTYYPISHRIIYSKGDDLLMHKINIAFQNAKKANKEQDNEKTNTFLAEKESWIDSLLMLYDQRIKYFGDDKKLGKGKLLGEKGKTIYKYRKKTQTDSAYEWLKESVEMLKDKSSPSIVQYFFFTSDLMYNSQKIDAIKVVEDYNTASGILSGIIKKMEKLMKEKPNQKRDQGRQRNINSCTKVLNNITQKFADGVYSKCDVLVPAFAPKFEENKTNADWLKKTTDILIDKKCTDSELYEKAVVALYSIEPSANAAYKIAKMYLGKVRYEDAANFYEKAFTQEENTDLKAKYYYEAALIANEEKHLSKSYSLAVKAANTKENYGNPHVLIAQLYVNRKGSCGKDAFERSWVYWVAVDKLIQAKSIDPSIADKANKLIRTFRAGFPSQEKAFMHGITPGNSVKVSCWFQATTKARFVK